MKKFVLLMIVGCFLANNSFGQEPENKNNPNAPEITFEETVHDFGKLPLNSPAECEFVFINTGKEPLTILNCQAGCGCTVPTCPKEPIKPGEKGTIKVKYTTTHVASPFNKQFTVTSNAKNSVVRITIKGEIIAPTPAEVATK